MRTKVSPAARPAPGGAPQGKWGPGGAPAEQGLFQLSVLSTRGSCCEGRAAAGALWVRHTPLGTGFKEGSALPCLNL